MSRPSYEIDYIDFEPCNDCSSGPIYVLAVDSNASKKHLSSQSRNRERFLEDPITQMIQRLEEEDEKAAFRERDRSRFRTKDWHPGLNQLWSMKYQPKSYLDLLTDEGINRSVLKWLKEFDKNSGTWKDRDQTIQQSSDKVPPMVSSKAKEMNEAGNNAPIQESSAISPLLLIAGPPGVGKTTSVHILARQAGPSILLLDEVEGCDRDAVDALVKLLEEKEKNGKPKIKRASSKGLFCRLTEICVGEGVDVDGSCLPKLIHFTDADIRSTLNSLQLIAKTFRAEGKRLSGEDIETFWDDLYHDRDIGELEVIQRLFTSPATKQTGRSKYALKSFKDMGQDVDFNILAVTLQDNLEKVRMCRSSDCLLCDSGFVSRRLPRQDRLFLR
ncbi:chromosome transmission fidelity protein 18 homolog [Condylostylus longicornis]|uniref:chromosome transmission fidelity protein 18 homolog n=1 Tax=Condylostylus longicornis TaxID=2530218 RepID=UPI00244E074D|nr:chromosome transmission fidelity protein 18 homolog [Condylostylus longicornis]